MERTYRTNVFAMVWLCQEVLEHMEPGGTIINTSSIQASDPSPALYDYATTKAAIGRAGQPAELAPAFVFLASQESSYITGETIAVTGGRLFG